MIRKITRGAWKVTQGIAIRWLVAFAIAFIPMYFYTSHLFGDQAGLAYAAEATAILSLYPALLLPTVMWFTKRTFRFLLQIASVLGIKKQQQESTP
jgi:Gpi18-like mannosyltransferase